jgi:acyl-CoA dehydrogenase
MARHPLWSTRAFALVEHWRKSMFKLTEEQRAIRDAVAAVCTQFPDEYWVECEKEARFPREFHTAMARDGWLGITMPERHGGAGLGVTEAAVVMHTVASHGGGMAAASSIHINMFGPHPMVVHGSDEQQARWIPRLVAGEDQVCFGVTEPDAGLDTTSIKTFAKKVDGGYRVSGRKMWISTAQVANKILLLTRTSPKADSKKSTDGITLFYTDLDRTKVEVRRIPKHGRAAVDSNAVFIDDLFVPDEDRLGEEGRGFHYLLDGLNPERILVAVEAIGIGQDALRRAALYARERVVFGRPIGKNQAIQHPLAECWLNLEAALLMAERAAELYDSGQPCGAEANGAKFLGARAGHQACLQAVLTHGGMGYAKEYHVERLMREVMIAKLAPVSQQLILCNVAEKVLGMPKSY